MLVKLSCFCRYQNMGSAEHLPGAVEVVYDEVLGTFISFIMELL